jgi:hypothetical protein
MCPGNHDCQCSAVLLVESCASEYSARPFGTLR